MAGHLNVQFGSGRSAPDGWLNFDASPSMRLERIPLLGPLLRLNPTPFPRGVHYGDIVRGLPVPDGSVKAVYASHVLEHLSYEDFYAALKNTFRMLAPGGVFRLIVPDLAVRATLYAKRVAEGDPDAAHQFMWGCRLGQKTRPRGLRGLIRSALGNSAHLSMWDEHALTKALREAGFVKIRPMRCGDAADPDFNLVEEDRRFQDPFGVRHCAMEATKPDDKPAPHF